jgi:hypothetical protein
MLFYIYFNDCILFSLFKKNIRLEVGTMVEVTDHKNTSRMKQGYVTEFKGSRHFIRYWDADEDAPNDSNSGNFCKKNLMK